MVCFVGLNKPSRWVASPCGRATGPIRFEPHQTGKLQGAKGGDVSHGKVLARHPRLALPLAIQPCGQCNANGLGSGQPLTARVPRRSGRYLMNLQWGRNASAGVVLCSSAARCAVWNNGAQIFGDSNGHLWENPFLKGVWGVILGLIRLKLISVNRPLALIERA